MLFDAYHIDTNFPVIWYPAPGFNTTNAELVLFAKQLLELPRALGRG